MKNEFIKGNVAKAVDELLASKGYVAPVDVLVKVGVLSQKDYAEWNRGKIPYLEKACNVDLSKVSMIMRELKSVARKKFLKPSRTVYKKWGKGAKGNLVFSKTRAKHIEEAYSTHYVGKKAKKEAPKEPVKKYKR